MLKNKSLWLALSLALLTPTAHAQIYKCTTNGKTAFQATPCADTGNTQQQVLDKVGGKSVVKRGAMPWDGLKAGMSVAEVKRLTGARDHKGAISPKGSQVLLRKEVSNIGKRKLIAQYYFDANGFELLTFTTNEATGTVLPAAEALNMLNAIVNQMQHQYGEYSEIPAMVQHPVLSLNLWELPGQGRLTAQLAIPAQIPKDMSVVSFGFKPSATSP